MQGRHVAHERRFNKTGFVVGVLAVVTTVVVLATQTAFSADSLQRLADQLANCQEMRRVAQTQAERDWANRCIALAQRAFNSASPTATATPTQTPTPSPTPTVTPTVDPTTPTTTPPPTTTPAPTTPVPTTEPPAPTTTAPPTTTPVPTTTPPVPTTTPAPSPTVAPSPSPTGSNDCMPQPSRCGFPDATNTGVVFLPLSIVNGDVTLTTPGQVYQNRDVRGCISVRAKNVTIRNVRVTCSTWYGIASNTGSPNIWNSPDANLLIEDTEINLGGSWEIKGIAFDGYTARRVHFYGGADCAHTGRNVVIEDSFCEIPSGGPANGPHYDGIQSDGGSNIVLRHNTIRVPYSQTSAILMSTNTSAISNVTIQDNLMAGGGWTVYCGTSTGGPVQGTLVYSGNRFARTFFPQSGYWGPAAYCPRGTGNVWDNTGLPL